MNTFILYLHRKYFLAFFPKCKFRYGRNYAGMNLNYSSYDYLTIWINLIAENCIKKSNCTDFNPNYHGNMLKTCTSRNIMPVFYSNIIVYEANNLLGNVDMAVIGSQFIRNNTKRILERYSHQSISIANYIGTNGLCIFLIEPNFWQ